MIKFLQVAFVACLCLAPIAPASAEILILSDRDADAYRAAFSAAERGEGGAALSALSRAGDPTLASHVEARLLLAQRRPSAAAFQAWLRDNRDHVLADAVRKRAAALKVRRLPRLEDRPIRIPNAAGRGRDEEARQAALAFGSGDFVGARVAAEQARMGAQRASGAWWLGLVSWREGDFAQAAAAFSEAGDAARSDWLRSQSRYWQGRALLAQGQTGEAVRAFAAAADAPATFYGQLAELQLGRDTPLSLDAPRLDSATAASLSARRPEAARAIALAQLGRLSDAELELSALHANLTAEDDGAYLALATALAAPAAQLRAADYGGREVAAGYCPTHTFEPNGGFTYDRALVEAIVRQESRFRPIAVSSSNAHGLMQLLPSTARDLDSGVPRSQASRYLHDPGRNLRLGQDYVAWLDATFAKGGDLARILAAYNGGPGWLSRWEAGYPAALDDPLLWIESLPREETRDYAKRVLSHLSLCRKKYGQAPAELLSLAQGRRAIYQRLDERQSAGSRPGAG